VELISTCSPGRTPHLRQVHYCIKLYACIAPLEIKIFPSLRDSGARSVHKATIYIFLIMSNTLRMSCILVLVLSFYTFFSSTDNKMYVI